jgi:thiosulfate/3-mercaptopyruvate sulfurtransferase
VADETFTLIEAEALSLALDSGCFLFDCRFSLSDYKSGRLSYDQGHIPGAQYADLNVQLSGPIIAGKTGRHPLPEQEHFLAQIRQWGVSNDSLVVAYDTNGIYAARLWWMFRSLGHEKVVVLNGGIKAWRDTGRKLDRHTPQYPVSDFEARTALTRSVQVDEVLSIGGKLTDAREQARFNGEIEPIDPVAGHIPGASCLPFMDNLMGDKLLTRVDLIQRFSEAGIDSDTQVTCYCGSGVTAAHNILALVHAGFPEPALYAGSWSEWITDPSRPIELGMEKIGAYKIGTKN